MKTLSFWICVFLVMLFLVTGCQRNVDEGNQGIDTLSITKYNEETGISYEETADGYKGAFYQIEDITIDKIKDWIEACDKGSQYYEYIYSDPDSWDMFIYYPFENTADVINDRFRFQIDNSIVKIYIESDDTSNQIKQSDYILIRVQAPARGVWPNASAVFIDNIQIEKSQNPSPKPKNTEETPSNTYTIKHEKDGAIYTVTVIDDSDYNYTLQLFDLESRQLQSFRVESVFVRIDFEDVNLDGYTDIVINTGGTWNETHDLYIWDVSSQGFIKVVFKGFEMLAWFEVYDGYIKNFIRGDNPDNSTMEKLIWDGNTLTKDLEWEKINDALDLLYNYLYDDESKERMIYIEFSDTNGFHGYEYQLYIDANPMRIEFLGMSNDNNYYLFWLNEQVYYDGEFHHATTGDFFAVNIETKEIIAQRGDTMPDEWNDKFPW